MLPKILSPKKLKTKQILEFNLKLEKL